jgi:hypothetical protein
MVLGEFRFRGKSGHSEARPRCPLMTQSGRRQRVGGRDHLDGDILAFYLAAKSATERPTGGRLSLVVLSNDALSPGSYQRARIFRPPTSVIT